MYLDRVVLYKELEKEFNSNTLVYITSDRQNMSAKIAHDVIDFFINHLDIIGPCKRISLYLYTRGGDTSAAWNIINLLRMYCDDLQVIVPHKAHSAGTIIGLGANEIVMTKQATLSPIDPSITTPLSPMIPTTMEPLPVSVEAVKGFLDFAKDELGSQNPNAMAQVFLKLTDTVHPLVLGEVYRSSAQIKMLAKRLLENQVTDEGDIQKIIEFLCSESGSHDYTINRREAADDLKLKIVKPTSRQYSIIKAIYDDINDELQFNNPFNHAEINGAYSVRRSILESIPGGSDFFVTEGEMIHAIGPAGEEIVHDKILFQGWRHDYNSAAKERLTIEEGKEAIEYETSGEFQL